MGREYLALNGGPHFVPSEAFSLFVSVKTQAEVDICGQADANGANRALRLAEDKFACRGRLSRRLWGIPGDPDPEKPGGRCRR